MSIIHIIRYLSLRPEALSDPSLGFFRASGHLDSYMIRTMAPPGLQGRARLHIHEIFTNCLLNRVRCVYEIWSDIYEIIIKCLKNMVRCVAQSESGLRVRVGQGGSKGVCVMQYIYIYIHIYITEGDINYNSPQRVGVEGPELEPRRLHGVVPREVRQRVPPLHAHL
jgi:hypothetical protein